FGFLGDGLFECLRIARVGPGDVPVELSKAVIELIDRSAIELTGRHDLIPRSHQGMKRDELRGVTRGDGEARTAILERRDALLEYGIRRIHDARIDVSKNLQIK